VPDAVPDQLRHDDAGVVDGLALEPVLLQPRPELPSDQ
jgi:hypothetical protein